MTRTYVQPTYSGKAALIAAMNANIADELAPMIIAAALEEDDREFVEDACIRLSTHPDPTVRGNAILALGHIARLFGQLSDNAQAIVRAGLNDSSTYVRGQANAAAGDLKHFLGVEVRDKKQRSTNISDSRRRPVEAGPVDSRKAAGLPSPREFMRGRRPDEFSDSTPASKPLLDRAQLEYHLSTITSRSQEVPFENFARRLAQQEICPNLLPHTGPTGGGDSKVDSETYPVAEELALAWYQGVQSAARERWAFAFSAKEDWKPKVRGDVRKIAATNRDYTRAFFVTNQFVRDKERADIEDELRNECNLDVRILDRSWILDCVFKNKREAIAIEELGLQPPASVGASKGPNDVGRETVLAATEKRIQEATEASRLTPTIVDDCLEAAELSAALELPRVETDGRFQRAQRFAERLGNKHQQLKVAYHWAWRTYFWLEDARACVPLYEKVEELAAGTDNVYELELLSNLWNVLLVGSREFGIGKDEWDPAKHAAVLKAECERLANDEYRPSSELQARTHLTFLRLMQKGPAAIDEVADSLTEIVKRASNLIGYPMDRFAELISTLGESVHDSEPFERLVELVADVTSKRAGDIGGARILFKRASQHMKMGKPYDALRVISPALPKLYKFETRQLMLRALWLTGSAYQDVGLLWAARGAYLFAASVAANEFWRKHEITPEQAVCYNKLKWLELQLGRIPHALAWHEVDRVVRSVLLEKGHDANLLNEGEQTFDSVLGILFLKCELSTLRHCEKMYASLEQQDLVVAPWALLHALGHEDPELAGFLSRESKTADEWFLMLRDQPASDDLPSSIEYEEDIKLGSNVLGCHVTASSPRDGGCVEIAESFVAGLEALLATAIRSRISAHQPSLDIRLERRDGLASPVEFALAETGGIQSVRISVARDVTAYSMSLNQQSAIKKTLSDALIRVFASCFSVGQKADLEQLFGQERALDRATNFANGFSCIGNTLGNAPKFAFEDWSGESTHKCVRSERWDVGLVSPTRPWNEAKSANEFDLERVKHSDVETSSVINLTLWDRAQWMGTAFGYGTDGAPVMGPVFKDSSSAEEIFKHWETTWGHSDANDMVRISIIRGISRDNPHWYRIAIGSDPAKSIAIGSDRAKGAPSHARSRLFQVVVRVNTMEATSSRNLDAFLEQYGRAKRFILTPAMVSNASGQPEFTSDRYLLKNDLHVRWAWQIGEQDIDSAAIGATDDPIVPPEQTDPPVAKLLARLRAESE